jgi:hypothetical protein
MTPAVAAFGALFALLWFSVWVNVGFRARTPRTAVLCCFAAVVGGLIIIYTAAAVIGANHHG